MPHNSCYGAGQACCGSRPTARLIESAVMKGGNRLDFWDLIDGAFLEQLDLGVAHRLV